MKTLLFTLFIFLNFSAFSQSCPGFTFYTQTEIDDFPVNYPNCTEIEETLWINGESLNDPITNLDGLSQLTSVAGVLAITNFEEGSTLDVSGLGNIISVAVFHTHSSPGIADFGLVNLETCSQGLWISNSGITNLTVFPSLQEASEFKINSNPHLTDLSGLENLINIEGSTVEIINNPSLVSVAELNLQKINFTLTIKDNENLTSIGLNNLISVETLNIINNASLTDLSGLENLYSVFDLRISGNNALVSIDALQNIIIVQSLWITQNENLSNCSIQSICNYLIYVNGNVYIINNDAGCNSEDEIIEQCGTNNSISGEMWNVKLNLTNGEYEYIPQANFVDAYSETYPSADPVSTFTFPAGIFSFETNIDPQDTYRINASFSEDFWASDPPEVFYSYNNHNTIPGTSDLKIYIPENLLTSYWNLSNELKNMQYEPVGEWASYSDWMKSMGNEEDEFLPQDVYHTLARILIADRNIYLLDDQAFQLSGTSVDMFAKLIKLGMDFRKLKSLTGIKKVDELWTKIINYVLKHLDLIKAIESQINKSSLTVAQKAIVKGLIFNSIEEFKKELVLGNSDEFAKAVSKDLFHKLYKEEVNDTILRNHVLADRINAFDYKQTTKEAFDSVLSLQSPHKSVLNENMLGTYDALDKAESLKIGAEQLDFITNIIDLGVGNKPSLYSAIVLGFRGLSLTAHATGTYYVVDQTFNTYDATIEGTYLSLDPWYYDKNKNLIVQDVLFSFYEENRVIKYKNDFNILKEQTFATFDSINYYINNNNRELAENKISEFDELESDLNNALFLYQAPILARSQNASQQIPEFDSIFNELIIQEKYNDFDNVSVMIWMAAYLEDENFNADTLYLSIDSLKMSLNALDAKISQCLQLTEGVEAPAFVAVADYWTESEIVMNEPIKIKALIKNVGAFEADRIFAQLKIHSSASILTDSIINIGSLLPDEENIVEWTVDLSGEQIPYINYSIVIDSTMALTKQANSMLTVSDYPFGISENKYSKYNKLDFYPNPNNGTIHINSRDLPEGKMEFALLDLMGKTVYQKLITNRGIDPELMIQLDSDIHNGLYFIRVRIDNQVYSNKIILK